MNVLLRETMGYIAASACALIADVAILWVLVYYFSWWYLAAATVSFLAGLTITYLLSVRLVFKHRRLSNPRIEFANFAAIGGVGLGINAVVMALAVRYLGARYLMAKCVAAIFTFIWNFVSRRQLLFVQSRSMRR
jgi:putative flippase GtrA